MQTHGPKRVYTPQSLEFWFGKLENDWAPYFDETQLELGRRIYRDGEVREIELGVSDAIIHRKVEKKEEYAVIEWNADGNRLILRKMDRTARRPERMDPARCEAIRPRLVRFYWCSKPRPKD